MTFCWFLTITDMEYRIVLTSLVPGALACGDQLEVALASELEHLDSGLVLSIGEAHEDVIATMSLDTTSLAAACQMGADALNRALEIVGLAGVAWECESGGASIEE